MQALLQRNSTWGIVSGEITLEASEDKNGWKAANWNAAGVIYSQVDSSIQPLIRESLADAKGMWDKLCTQYSQDSAASRFLLLDEFLSITKQPDESLTALCARLENALQKVKASCKPELTVKAFQEELAMMTLIRSLPEEFSNFRSSLLLVPGSLDLKTVKEAFLQEERNRQPRVSEQLAMRAAGSSSSSSRQRRRYNGPACTHPGCRNPSTHSTENCYIRARELVKRADRQEQRNRGAQGARQVQESFHSAETAEFAANASAIDFTDPHSPLLPDAGANWIADTGATSHMTPHRHWFSSYTPTKRPIRLADNQLVYAVGIGSVRFLPCIKGRSTRLIEFHDVLHVPDLRSNLLSVLYLTRCKQYTVHISSQSMFFYRSNQLLITAAIQSNNSACLDGQIVPMSDFAGRVSTCDLDSTLWHRRFCHLNREDVQRIIKGDIVSGVTVKSKQEMDPICEPCLAGKQHRVSVPKLAQHRSSVPLQLVHSDVHGPLPVRSRQHYQYWITFIDDATRYWAVLPLKNKSDAFAAFKQYKAFAENQLNSQIKCIRDDKGGEYMSGEWQAFCSAHGIQRQHTVRAEPHQNGVAERANRTLMEAIIAMLNESKLPGSFWLDALTTFVHVHNRSPTAANKFLTPYQLWHGSAPDVSHFRVFGCTSYVHVKKDKRSQLQSHTEKCIFIGYPVDYKAWRFWNPVTQKEVISNTAEFDERYFPGNSKNVIDWPLSPLHSETSQHPVDPVGDIGNVDPPGFSIFPGAQVKQEKESEPTRSNTPEQAPQHSPSPAPTPSRSPSPPAPSAQSPLRSPSPRHRTPTPPPAEHHSPSTPGPQHTQTPKASPEQERKETLKRQLQSPASDLSSPEHVRQRRPPPVPPKPPRPVAPEFTAEPMSNFRPAATSRDSGWASYESSPYTHSLSGSIRARQPIPDSDEEMDSVSSGEQQSVSSQEQEQQQQQQQQERSSSPDPLNLFEQDDALIANALKAILDDHSSYFTLQEAVEFAFAVKQEKRLPSEPAQWRNIKGRPDAAQWHAAALEEFNALLENGTFVPVQLPPDRKAIGCRWVFKLKRKPDGSVDRYKARLVAKGFSQRPGLDFGQVFAPTARWAALRAIFALAAIQDLELYSLDISNAFLNGELDHEVYMQTPEGFKDRFGSDSVLKLNRALYGLKQAGHQWHRKLDSVLSSMQFKLVRCDNSIWVYKRDSVHIIVPVYVDDMTVACRKQEEYDLLVQDLKRHFKLKELGPISSLLGVAVQRDRSKRQLTLSQRQFTQDILERFGLANVHPVSTPLDPGMRLSKEQAPKDDEERSFMQKVPYAELVGAIMYLAVATRPDIAHAVGVLSRFSSNPGPTHWTALKHLCRYLQGTKDAKLCYGPDSEQGELFTAYADADFGGDPDTRRSTSGMVVKMGTGAISWASKLQPVVTLSTTEAEYISATAAGQEILWLRNLFSELGYEIKGASSLYLDNQSALAVTRNPEHHGRMKHLDLRHYWLRDTVKAGLIDVRYISTNSMPADIMTKALPKGTVQEMRRMLGLEV